MPPPMPLLPDGRRIRWVRAPLAPILCISVLILPGISFLLYPSDHHPPGETYGLLVLWAWCGYRVFRDRTTPPAGEPSSSPGAFAVNGVVRTAQLAEFGTDVGGAHEGLADQDRADADRL